MLVLLAGALTSGQRQWADIFFDKWRRLLNEFFDSSDYEVAEGTAHPLLTKRYRRDIEVSQIKWKVSF